MYINAFQLSSGKPFSTAKYDQQRVPLLGLKIFKQRNRKEHQIPLILQQTSTRHLLWKTTLPLSRLKIFKQSNREETMNSTDISEILLPIITIESNTFH
jgi:hypothetical protein